MHLSSLDVYPVKGLHGNSLAEAEIHALGIVGDRRWLVVNQAGKFLSQRELPAMAWIRTRPVETGVILSDALGELYVPAPPTGSGPLPVTVWRDEVRAEYAGAEAADWLSARLGQACRLVYMADPDARPVAAPFGKTADRVSFADGFPVLLANMASLAELNTRLALPIPMQRFRANCTIHTDDPWSEDGWRRVRIGAVVLRVVKPCTRCTVPSIDQDTGERPDKMEPLRTLARYRRDSDGGVVFGQNAIPERPGVVRVGDQVELLD